MGKVYKKTTRYKCLGHIYYQGKAFGESGRILIESVDKKLFVPGIINICLSAEIFLKSINAFTEYEEDELDINGATVYQGRDGTFKTYPGGKGHILSKLFDNLPYEAKSEIEKYAKDEGYSGCVSSGLKKYDDVFVEWRYIYEKNTPETLGTHPLFQLVNAIYKYCENNCDQVLDCVADEIK